MHLALRVSVREFALVNKMSYVASVASHVIVWLQCLPCHNEPVVSRHNCRLATPKAFHMFCEGLAGPITQHSLLDQKKTFSLLQACSPKMACNFMDA